MTRAASRTRSIALLAAALGGVALGCVHQRNIDAPVAGAIELTLPDSARYVIRAAEQAITDEGISILFDDRKRGFVQSRPTGVNALRSRDIQIDDSGPENVVTFRFRTRQELGVTRVSAEAVYQPVRGGGRSSERMVPSNTVGHEVLLRVIDRMQQHVVEAREQRERKQREVEQQKQP